MINLRPLLFCLRLRLPDRDYCLYHTGKEWSFDDCEYATEDNVSPGMLYSIETDLLPCPEVKWFHRFNPESALWTLKISLAP